MPTDPTPDPAPADPVALAYTALVAALQAAAAGADPADFERINGFRRFGVQQRVRWLAEDFASTRPVRAPKVGAQ